MAIVPGEMPERDPGEELLSAQEPLPPGREDIAEQVEGLDQQIRESGSEEIEKADREADAVEGDPGEEETEPQRDEPGSDADADQDPTSDQGADAEDPEAQDGAPGEPS